MAVNGNTVLETERNKDTIRRFISDVLNGRNFDLMAEVAAPDYQNYVLPSQPFGLDGFRPAIGAFFAGFPDLHFELLSIIAEGDSVAGPLLCTGTHQGEFNGIPPSGKQIRVSAQPYYRLPNGKIVEDWPGLDLLQLLQQLGAAPQLAAPATP